MQKVQPLWKTACQFHKKLRIWCSDFTPRNAREMETYVHTKMCKWMFILLFIGYKRQRQCKCPSTDEQNEAYSCDDYQ